MKMKSGAWKKISRLAVIACAFVLMLAMGITALATAETGSTIYVKGDNTNIRSEASTDSEVVGKLNANAPLTVQGVTSASDGHNWYQVSCVINGEEKTGYIREDLVEIPEGGDADTGEGNPDEPEEGTGENSTPEDGETAPPVEPSAEGTPGSALTSIGALTPMDSGTVPEHLPENFRAKTIDYNGTQIPAWADDANEYVVFYASAQDGNTGWYLCDKISGGYVRYGDFMGSAAQTMSTVSSNGEGVSKTAFIIVIVLCVLLVVATLIMGIKLMNGGGHDDYDDDDYDDDDEEDEPKSRKESVFKKFSRAEEDYDDDDYDDEEDYDDEYDEEYENRRGSGRQTHQVVVQQGARPSSQGQPRSSGQVSQSRQPVQQRPSGQPRQTVSSGQSRQAVQTGQSRQQRPAGSPVPGQQRYTQRQAGQQRYAQRTTQRRDDEY